MRRSFIFGIIAALLVGLAGYGVYWFVTQREGGEPPVNEDINALGLHVLSDQQKEQFGIPVSQDATIEVKPSDTSEGAVIRVLDIAPDPTKPKDSDGDGLSDDEEAAAGTNPDAVDTDGDLALDNEEFTAGLDPNNPDTLGTGEGDIMVLINTPKGEIDADKDGLPMEKEKELGTDPLNPDTDGDGFSDGTEVEKGYNPIGPGTL